MEYAQEIIPGIYEEEKRLIQQAERQGKLVLFVGAGASIPSGLPAWKKAINLILSRLNDYIDKEKDISSEALKIPQYYFNKYGEHDYKQLMYQIFRRNDFLETNEIHKLIFKFKTSHIITTNYDCLLEQAAKEAHQFVYVIKQDRDIPYRTSEKK